MKKRNILLHVHIFKNAGSSFDDALRRFFKNDFVDHRDDADIVKGKMNYLINYLDEHSNIQAFSSHSIHFIPQNTEKYNFFPVYFLRHPIDRIRSVYSFEKKQVPANTQGSQKAKQLNFEDYINWYMEKTSPHTIKNVQTIFLSGMGPGSNDLDKAFNVAISTLKTSYMVGVVDRYDESMVVFEEYLKDYFPEIDLSYIRRNVTDTNLDESVEEKAKKVLSQLDDKTQKKVIEKNAFDMQLYTEANSQLDTKISKIDDFEKKLENFKERCILKLVQQKINKKDFTGVIDLLFPIAQKGLSTVKLYLELANAYKELKQYPEALKMYEETMKKFPNNPWAYFYEAEMYWLMGNTEEAKVLFYECKNKFKDSVELIKIFKNKLERLQYENF